MPTFERWSPPPREWDRPPKTSMEFYARHWLRDAVAPWTAARIGLAVLMAGHARCGKDSPLHVLPRYILGKVARRVPVVEVSVGLEYGEVLITRMVGRHDDYSVMLMEYDSRPADSMDEPRYVSSDPFAFTIDLRGIALIREMTCAAAPGCVATPRSPSATTPPRCMLSHVIEVADLPPTRRDEKIRARDGDFSYFAMLGRSEGASVRVISVAACQAGHEAHYSGYREMAARPSGDPPRTRYEPWIEAQEESERDRMKVELTRAFACYDMDAIVARLDRRREPCREVVDRIWAAVSAVRRGHESPTERRDPIAEHELNAARCRAMAEALLREVRDVHPAASR